MCISAARLGPERVSEEVDVLRRSHGRRVQRVCTEDQVAGVDQDAEGDNDDIYIMMECLLRKIITSHFRLSARGAK